MGKRIENIAINNIKNGSFQIEKKSLVSTIGDGSDYIDDEVGKLIEGSAYCHHILSYDLDDYFVFHTAQSILDALKIVSADLLAKFKEQYSRENEIQDCADTTNDIAHEVSKILNPDQNKHFYTLSDFCSEQLIEQNNKCMGA